MADPTTLTEWQSAWTRAANLDGADWDAEIERLEALWGKQYRRTFINHATSRKWTKRNATLWADSYIGEALMEHRNRLSPHDAAIYDVLEGEREQ